MKASYIQLLMTLFCGLMEFPPCPSQAFSTRQFVHTNLPTGDDKRQPIGELTLSEMRKSAKLAETDEREAKDLVEEEEKEEDERDVYFDSETPFQLKCKILPTQGNVIWERTDLVYPLAVGGYVFSPDVRIRVEHPTPTTSLLKITNATKEDALNYRCRSSKSGPSEYCERPQQHPTCLPFERLFRTVFGKRPSLRIHANDQENQKDVPKSKVIVSGPQLAFYGMPLELICRINYFSPDAKLNPAASPAEWFLNGVRRRPSKIQSGGTFISSRWVDSDLVESRLLITWTTEKDAGRWHCVDRSAMLMSARKLQHQRHHQAQNNVSDDLIERMSDSAQTDLVNIANTMSFAQLNVQIIAPPPLLAFSGQPKQREPAPELVPEWDSKAARIRSLTGSSGSSDIGRNSRQRLTSTGYRHLLSWMAVLTAITCEIYAT